MKKSALAALFSAALLFANSLIAQNNPPTLTWAKSFGGPVGVFDGSASLAIDAAGNVFTLGMFEGTIDFEPGPGVTTLTSNGQLDIFIQKSDAAGNFLWVKSVGGDGYDVPNAITTDASGNIYMTGIVYDTLDFDPGASVFTVNTDKSVFILKLDNNGNFLMAKVTEGSGTAYGAAINVDAAGNIFVAGEFNGLSDFDPGIGTSNFVSAGTQDGFLLKLDAGGNFVWVKTIGSAGYESITSVTTDAVGTIYAGGYFTDTVDIDPGVAVQTTISNGNRDAFIWKLDAAGNLTWSTFFGGTGPDALASVAVDNAGEIYCGGHFENTVDLDPGAGVFSVTSNAFRDFFVEKFDAAGNFSWAWASGGSGYDQTLKVCLDAANNVYAIGQFKGAVDFDPGTGTNIITGIANGSTFLQKFSSTGTMLWTETLNADYQSIGRVIAVDAFSNIYMVGDFRDAMDIAPGPGIFNLVTNGEYDVFISKFNQCNTWSFTNQTTCDSVAWMGNTYTTSGTYSDTLLNSAGCDSVQYFILIVNNNDTTISVSGVTLTANESGAVYQWLDCDNAYAIISGENAQSYTPTSNGNFAVSITKNGCVDTSSCYAITTTGINKNNFEEAIIFPNPNNGTFTIKTKVFGKYCIVNSLGQVIRSSDISAENTFVSVNNLSNGVYFLVGEDGKVTRHKIIVLNN